MTKHQKVKDLEKKLLSLLCSSKNDDYWRLTQKVAGTVSAGKEVRSGKRRRRELGRRKRRIGEARKGIDRRQRGGVGWTK